MLCCGGKQDPGGRDMKSAQNTPSRQPLVVHQKQQQQDNMGNLAPPPGGDFKKVSGISNEIFRQIETVENRYDQTTAEAFKAVQKSGEMVVRKLEASQFIRLASETAANINVNTNDPNSVTSFVEIVKRPGQTLGLYIREGNGLDRSDGVFVSRIALESAVYSSECILVGDEILAVNLVDVTRMSLDDVVIIMSIPRRLVLTTRRSKSMMRNPVMPGGPPMQQQKPTPVVVLKGGESDLTDARLRGGLGGMGGPPQDRLRPYSGRYNEGGGGGPPPGWQPSGGDGIIQDSRTLTWDRNPRPDRSDPKYFPVNSLPRQQQQQQRGSGVGGYGTPSGGMQPPDVQQEWYNQQQHQGQPREYMYTQQGPVPDKNDTYSTGSRISMPPPMHALNSYKPPPPVVTDQPRQMKDPHAAGGYTKPMYNGFPGGVGPGGPVAGGRGGPMLGPRDPRAGGKPLLNGGDPKVFSPGYSVDSYNQGIKLGPPHDPGYSDMGGGMQGPPHPGLAARKGYDTLSSSWRPGGPGGRSTDSPVWRHHQQQQQRSMDYASDTDIPSPPRSLIETRGRNRTPMRSNSLPRTFNREALLRHPELSMEMDRLSDTLSETGERLPLPNQHRGKSPSFSTIGEHQEGLKRTPSTSAIYETLRRSKELRESLSRPSSRLSMDNIPDRLKDPENLDYHENVKDVNYYSDSEHQSIPRQEIRRLRNRTLSGLDSLRIGQQVRERSQSLSMAGGVPPGGVTVRTPCTPTLSTAKDAITNFVEFNPADFVKYKMDRFMENKDVRLSGSLHLHLLSGRGLKTSGRFKRFRDLYCVVEVDHVHKARTVVRSGGLNFDWDEKFQLDLLNNLEVEFLIYSWDPQLRHRLCYRTSLRLGALFSGGQMYHQIALRLHPAGVIYLTLRYTTLKDTYNRSTNTAQPGHLFGTSLDCVLERENSGFLVPLIVRRSILEIEKRGLDIIGLYRLCGSETKKSLLREAFEEDPETVDLSSENVPDINVITSLLKEYLRELPEPVFSSCLFQMLVDALGVFIPDDPDGNAKLVLSILDCLPKSNKNCLIQILDHLSGVSSQSARNKMNPHNLAICFAPVLMLDTSDTLDHEEPGIVQQLQILKYLIEIWPKSQENL